MGHIHFADAAGVAAIGGDGSGSSFTNPKLLTNASFQTWVQAGGTTTDDEARMLNTIRAPMVTVFQTITKRIKVLALKADGSEPVEGVDLFPVFYGSAAGERMSPWPMSQAAAAAAPVGTDVFRYSNAAVVGGVGPTFKNLRFLNVKSGIKLVGSAHTDDMNATISNVKGVNVEMLIATTGNNDGSFSGTIDNVRCLGYTRAVVRVWGKGSVNITRVAGDSRNQAEGSGDFAAGIVVLEDALWDNDRSGVSMTTQGTSTVLCAGALATDAGAGITRSGIPADTLIGSVVPGVSFGLVNRAGAAVNATNSTTANGVVVKHARLGTEVQVNVTIDQVFFANGAAAVVGLAYRQGDGVIGEEQIHPLSTFSIDRVTTRNHGDRGVDVKCGATVRRLSSQGDYRGFAQHRTAVVTGVGPLVLTPVVATIIDSVVKECSTDRAAASGIQASGNMNVVRCLVQQTINNSANASCVRTDVNTNGAPYDAGVMVLSGRCRLIKGSLVVQSVNGGASIDLGDSIAA